MARAKTARRKAAQKELVQHLRNKRLLLEATEEAGAFASKMRTHSDPAEAVSEILDNIMTMYRQASMRVMTLGMDEYFRDTIGGQVPNEWIREQERLGMQAVHVAGKAAGMGLAERQVRIQEAQAAIFGTVVEAALVAAGLSMDDRRAVHQSIAEGLEDIEATAEDLPVGRLAA
jgi:phosphosulfolactate synthase (CoM biosynthesis protein A)